MKKFLCMILAVAMMFSVSVTPAYATTSISQMDQYVITHIPDMMTQLSSRPERYGLTQQDLEGAYVSSSFVVENTEDGIYYYALMNENKVLGIITVFPAGDGYSLSFGKEFSDVLTASLEAKTDISLTWADDGITLQTEEVKNNFLASTLVGRNVGVKSSLKQSICEASVPAATYSTNNNNFSGELEDDFPIIWQHDGAPEGSDNGFSCAVTCGKAMAQYFEPSLSNLTVRDVIGEVYGFQEIASGNYFVAYDRVPEIFDMYVDNSYSKYPYALSLTALKNNIDSNNPILCLVFSPIYTNIYHGVVITSYTYGSVSRKYMINVMDPLDPTWKIIFWDGVTDFTMTFGGSTEAIWEKSIVLHSN